MVYLGISSAPLINAEEITELPATIQLAQDAEGGEGGELSPGEQANADFQDKLSGAELLNALQEGGYVIYCS